MKDALTLGVSKAIGSQHDAKNNDETNSSKKSYHANLIVEQIMKLPEPKRILAFQNVLDFLLQYATDIE